MGFLLIGSGILLVLSGRYLPMVWGGSGEGWG